MKKIIISLAIVFISAVAMKSDWGLFDGIISTNSISNVTTTSAVSGGYINLMADDPSVTEKGIVWNTSPNPTTDTNIGETTEGAGPTQGNSLSYTSNLSNLTLNTTYYVRAYLINGDGTSYGQQVVFTTIPTLGEWGVIALVSLMGIFGVWMVRRRI
jgi:hypothetical protein